MPTPHNNTLQRTEYDFPGQTDVYHGKVRDVYTIKDKYLVMVATDRISAFDRILPRPIPYKGQILNQIADYFLNATGELAPNWLISMPDANVSLGYKCEPFKVEVVVRGMLVGHAWREYASGRRELCGLAMPEDMQEYELFTSPLITPTTKAEAGHDEDISAVEVINRGLATKTQFDEMCTLALNLFEKGQSMAAQRGLLLADTKYEFGLQDGRIILIDEIHTPDSSRYFYRDSYEAFIKDRSLDKPKHLSKEFVRTWLMDNGFSGQEGQEIPEMTDEVVKNISDRYIELYEQITGRDFVKPTQTDIVKRIEANVNEAIKELD
ncbi:MAG TPA: phosphoribosylaminoimidazolesuccinocarboxamide synthase [Candidatus Saccharimonadales bacterium]|nr:phosphoribosylaminoimidazolesuccinocarboxamide synthase [Candidatus Saccharimonadales bacterium]